MQRPQLSLKGRALRLLSGREHSRSELERKLAGHEEEPGQLRRVLDELQAKGIAPEAIAEAVAGLQDTEVERATALWRRRFDAPPADAKERAKQMRFLMARGFSGAVVSKVLRSDFDEAGE